MAQEMGWRAGAGFEPKASLAKTNVDLRGKFLARTFLTGS